MTEVKCLFRMEPIRLLVFCLSLFGLLESFFSSVLNDEIWVLSVQDLPPMNHNYSPDYFHSHNTGK